MCPGNTITLHSNEPEDARPAWEVNKGNGYESIPEAAPFSGTRTMSLTITNTGTHMQGWKFRLITGGNAVSPYELYFAADWTGDQDIYWNVPQNWKCGIMPDEQTDVIINSNTFNYPTVNVEAVIRSLKIRRQAMMNIAPGIRLELRQPNLTTSPN